MHEELIPRSTAISVQNFFALSPSVGRVGSKPPMRGLAKEAGHYCLIAGSAASPTLPSDLRPCHHTVGLDHVYELAAVALFVGSPRLLR